MVILEHIYKKQKNVSNQNCSLRSNLQPVLTHARIKALVGPKHFLYICKANFFLILISILTLPSPDSLMVNPALSLQFQRLKNTVLKVGNFYQLQFDYGK